MPAPRVPRSPRSGRDTAPRRSILEGRGRLRFGDDPGGARPRRNGRGQCPGLGRDRRRAAFLGRGLRGQRGIRRALGWPSQMPGEAAMLRWKGGRNRAPRSRSSPPTALLDKAQATRLAIAGGPMDWSGAGPEPHHGPVRRGIRSFAGRHGTKAPGSIRRRI